MAAYQPFIRDIQHRLEKATSLLMMGLYLQSVTEGTVWLGVEDEPPRGLHGHYPMGYP